MLEQRLRYVKVTNKFDTPYVDMFDGIPVTIDAGGTQNLQPEQAFHFFGYTEDASRQQMLLHVAKRRGWNTAAHLQVDESGKTLAERLFENLVIEPVTFKLVEEAPGDIDRPIPAEGAAEGDEGVEHAPPPPKFEPVAPRAKPASKPTAAKSAPKGRQRDDDDE
jgi:hypothetical protein